MIIAPGFTFLSPTPEYNTNHLFIVISVNTDKTKAFFVNVTTKKESSDTSCVLKVGDHEFITRDSVINYADATVSEIDKLEQAIKMNVIKPHKPTTGDLLNRVLKGAFNSEALPKGYLKYLPQ